MGQGGGARSAAACSALPGRMPAPAAAERMASSAATPSRWTAERGPRTARGAAGSAPRDARSARLFRTTRGAVSAQPDCPPSDITARSPPPILGASSTDGIATCRPHSRSCFWPPPFWRPPRRTAHRAGAACPRSRDRRERRDRLRPRPARQRRRRRPRCDERRRRGQADHPPGCGPDPVRRPDPRPRRRRRECLDRVCPAARRGRRRDVRRSPAIRHR